MFSWPADTHICSHVCNGAFILEGVVPQPRGLDSSRVGVSGKGHLHFCHSRSSSSSSGLSRWREHQTCRPSARVCSRSLCDCAPRASPGSRRRFHAFTEKKNDESLLSNGTDPEGVYSGVVRSSRILVLFFLFFFIHSFIHSSLKGIDAVGSLIRAFLFCPRM